MQRSHPRKAALIVEYDGTSYRGFQYQPGVPTVQSEIESAIHRLTLEKARIKAAGRTDVGVHAKGQAVAFLTRSNLSPGSLLSGLNHFLPSDVAVKKACYVDVSFDPRRHAVSRVYRYSILNSGSPSPLRERYSARVVESLDEDAMRLALDWMIGEHDFAPLSGPVPPGKSTVRRILVGDVDRDEDTVRFQVEANAFLPHQIAPHCRAARGCRQRSAPPLMPSRPRCGAVPTLGAQVWPGQCLPRAFVCCKLTTRTFYPMATKHNRTHTARQADIISDWQVLDAAGKPLGRLASEIARVLAGQAQAGLHAQCPYRGLRHSSQRV